MDAMNEMRFSSFVGVIDATSKTRFERMLFRATRGNCYVRFAEAESQTTDLATGKLLAKHVFIVFFKSATIERIITKIATAFAAKRYPVPVDPTEPPARLQAMIADNHAELNEARKVLMMNRDLRLLLCKQLAQQYTEWSWTVLREKSIYHTLNMCRADVSGMLRAEGWVVAAQAAEARARVTKAHADVDLGGASLLSSVSGKWPTPPTSFDTNAFTTAFQEFVDTYGVPRYKEINPALFTAATFPFLFGIMYGDIGHGLCLLIGGIYLVLSYESANGGKDGGEMVRGVYGGRYMITLMGVFAVYAGFVYNDAFSLTMNLFGSTWEWGDDPESGAIANNTAAYGDVDSVYPFGLDPAWRISQNELLFGNSFKMKLSVVLGITQMTLGIVLRGVNCVYFGEKLEFYTEFLPMIVFDLALFGYMVILIFTKWSIDWDERQYMSTCVYSETLCDASSDYYCVAGKRGHPCAPGDEINDMCLLDYGPKGTSKGCVPPNLINTLISIALSPGSCDEPMFKGQAGVQVFVLLVAFMAVPVLLFGKPCVLANSSHGHGHGHNDVEMTQMGEEEEEEEHSFGEMMIHQAIETIEFVLGMVSNTASCENAARARASSSTRLPP